METKNLTLDEIKDLIRFAREELVFKLEIENLRVEFTQLAFVQKVKNNPIKAIDPVNQQEIEEQKQEELEETRYYSAE